MVFSQLESGIIKLVSKHFNVLTTSRNLSCLSSSSLSSSLFEISDEIKDAINTNKPVVALESTVITHGLPYPDNLNTAKLLENEVRKNLSIPATIALINGKIKIGLTNNELEMISDPENESFKVSVRDISNILERKIIGGTTVAATMRLAHMCGIKVFATGGIGGVHRGAENTFDISADLIELGKTPIAVVCAGAKSILDIPKTLEYLETQSCNVIVYGNEPYFPGFFTNKTNEKAPFLTDNLSEIANILVKTENLSLNHGTLIACPPPNDEGEKIEKFIQQAVNECVEKRIESKAVTPYILSRVNELTDGKSKEINIALLRNNANIAAKLAKLYSDKRQLKDPNNNSNNNNSKGKVFEKFSSPKIKTGSHHSSAKKPKVLTVGAAIVDFEVITDEDVKSDGGSYKGRIIQRCGGVGRNHADALGRLGCESTLLTSIGDDDMGQYLLRHANNYSLEHAHVGKNGPTATYMSVNIKGSIVHGFSSVEEAISRVTSEYIKSKEDLFSDKDYIIIDGNVSNEALDTVVDIAKSLKIKIWFEPTDIQKASKILFNENHQNVTSISPNFNEMNQYVEHFMKDTVELNEFEKLINSDYLIDTPIYQTIQKMLTSMNSSEGFYFLTIGSLGILAFHKNEDKIYHHYIPPVVFGPDDKLVSVSGAGDSFNSGFLASHLYGKSFEDSLKAGMKCVQESLKVTEAVSDTLSPQLIGV